MCPNMYIPKVYTQFHKFCNFYSYCIQCNLEDMCFECIGHLKNRCRYYIDSKSKLSTLSRGCTKQVTNYKNYYKQCRFHQRKNNSEDNSEDLRMLEIYSQLYYTQQSYKQSFRSRNSGHLLSKQSCLSLSQLYLLQSIHHCTLYCLLSEQNKSNYYKY